MSKFYKLSDIIGIFIDDISKIFIDNDMFNVIDETYESLTDISLYGDKTDGTTYTNYAHDSVITYHNYINNEMELFSELFDRTSIITKELLINENYKNTLLVTSGTVINAIIINIFKSIYGDSYMSIINKQFNGTFKNQTSFCKYNVIKPGEIIKIDIIPVIKLDNFTYTIEITRF
jgi:hypothetical protein